MAREMTSPVAEVKASKPKMRKVLKSIEVERSLDGGHTITHRFNGYEHEPQPYKFGKNEGAKAAAHIAKHTGIPMADPETEEYEAVEGDEEV